MAIQYHLPLLLNFMSSGLRYGLSESNAAALGAATLFKGTQPTAANILASWTTYNVSALVHWTGFNWLTPPETNTLSTPKSTTTSLSSASTAFGTGTAEWAILWPTATIQSVTEAGVQAATIPTNLFIVVPASGPVGNGVVKVPTTNIVSGSSYSFTDITIRMGIS